MVKWHFNVFDFTLQVGETPLHVSARYCHLAVGRELLLYVSHHKSRIDAVMLSNQHNWVNNIDLFDLKCIYRDHPFNLGGRTMLTYPPKKPKKTIAFKLNGRFRIEQILTTVD